MSEIQSENQNISFLTGAECLAVNTDQIDAIQIIVYDTEGDLPDTQARKAIEAAADLISGYHIPNVVIGGVNRNNISHIYAAYLERQLLSRRYPFGVNLFAEGDDDASHIIDVRSRDTGGELAYGQTQAKRYGWNRMLIFSHPFHEARIHKLLYNRGYSVNEPGASGRQLISLMYTEVPELLGIPFELDRHPTSTPQSNDFVKYEQTMRNWLNYPLNKRGEVTSLLAQLMRDPMKRWIQEGIILLHKDRHLSRR